MSPRVPARRGADRSTRAYVDVRAETGQALNLLRVAGWVVLHEAAGSTADHIIAGPAGAFVVSGARSGELPPAAVARLQASGLDVAAGLGVPVGSVLCVADPSGWVDRTGDALVATPASIVTVLAELPEELDGSTLAGVARVLVTGVQRSPRSSLSPEPAAEPVPGLPPASGTPVVGRHAAEPARTSRGALRRAAARHADPVATEPAPAGPPAGAPAGRPTGPPPPVELVSRRAGPPPPVAVVVDAPGHRRRQRMGGRELLRWLVVLVLMGAVAFGALHARALADWGKGLFTEPPHPVGTTVQVAASTYHPRLDVRVDRVMEVPATGLAPGQHAVAARVRITNVGDSTWRMGSGTSVRLLDELGVAHQPAAGVRVDGLARLPDAATVRTNGTLEGYVVATLPRDRTAWRVEVRLAPSGEDTLVWALPR